MTKEDTVDMKAHRRGVENIARVCHEANRAYCCTIGDTSQPSWEDAPEWQKASAIDGVNFLLEEDRGPEASHENWLRTKEKEGWVYGPTKDPEKKTHPCCVPYADLPPKQKLKDAIFHAIVNVMGSEEASTLLP